jgi:LmbE family N-acetylglucosaminyl deacetylase
VRRLEGRIAVVTVFAGTLLAGVPRDWDRRAGFGDAAEAARARRKEDARACALVGATPSWLPFDPQQRRTSTIVADALRDELARLKPDLVLVPGFPLRNPDHLWLTRTVLCGRMPYALGLYVEQPYAGWRDVHLPDRSGRLADLVPALSWTTLPAGSRSRRAKRAACAAYTSQRPLLAGRALPLELRVWLRDRRVGGESVALLASSGAGVRRHAAQ